MNKKLFLSAVSSEFERYRMLLADDLKRPTLDVAVQEDFNVTDGTTLQKLDTYIEACDGVVHLIGKAVGAVPETVAVQQLLERYPDLPTKLTPLADALSLPDPGLSYTQWEAWLAIYHDRPIFIYRPTDFDLAICECPREDRFKHDTAQEEAQRQHYKRICAMGRDRGQFLNPERLSSAVLRDLADILPALEKRIDVPVTRLTHTAEQLVGRERELTVLDEAWNNPHINLIVVRGKGGEGKTSLVATWMAELAFKDWRGAERVIDWSFYSQGTREQTSATAEFFINQALTDLGDPDPNVGGPAERAARLVRLINAQRTLLVLDGLEPLQYPPGAMHGALKDAGMAALLRGLVAQNKGLVVVTTREKVTEIQQHYGRSAIDHDLTFLSPLAGAQVLYNAGATRAGAADIQPDDKELQQASEEVHGHALTLFLVGQYLRLIEHSKKGDIRKRDTMGLAEAEHEYRNDATRPYGHAFKAIEAYEKWFTAGDEQAKLQLSVLRLLGLFDRLASAECLQALRTAGIAGVTDQWNQRTDRDWSKTLSRMEEINLIEVHDNGTVDCHPLIREYFAEQLRTKQPEAFRAGHSRLFDHLYKMTDHQPDTLDGLQPLYQAVVHGCLAGRQQEACVDVYHDRILRGAEGFSIHKLGAIGADLSAVAAFFDQPWTVLSPNLSEPAQAWLLNEAAFRLRTLGRLTEAVELMRVTLEINVNSKHWTNAATVANNLSELQLTLGRAESAVSGARRAIKFADRSEDAFLRMASRTGAADAMHQFGEHSEAAELFSTAERLQQERKPQFPLLYSTPGFRYCDLLLAPAERAAWQRFVVPPSGGVLQRADELPPEGGATNEDVLAACDEAERRATQTLEWVTVQEWVLDIALDHLTLARAALYRAILTADPGHMHPSAFTLPPDLTSAVNGLRQAGTTHHLPKGLLTAAVWYHLSGDTFAAISAINEAEQIAARGPMPLYTADIFLTRARLFRKREAESGKRKKDRGEETEYRSSQAGSLRHAYPWPDSSPAADLAAARRIIEETHYHRRLGELEDAERSLNQ